MLIKEAISILQKANTKIAELGVEVVTLEDSNSPGAPEVREQLNESVIRYDLLLKFITLNDAGTAILGTTGDNDSDLNALLIQLQEIADLNEFVLPSPIIRIVETNGSGNLPDGASEGDLVYYHNGAWVLLPKGASGESLVSTTTSIQWQSQVGNGIPSGGSTGQVLRKASNSDYIVEWHTPVLADITDVNAGAADVNILLGAYAAGVTPTNIAHLSGSSSNIQEQLNARVSTTLSNGQFLIGNGSNLAVSVTPTGDVTFTNSGVFSITSGVIVNGDISASANITRTKLANGNAWRVLVNNGSGVISEASSITASRVLVSDSNGIPTHTTVSTTTIGYMDATSSVQAQLNNRLQFSSSITPAQGDLIYFNGTTWINLGIGTNGQLLKSNGTIPVWTTDPPAGLPAGGTTNQYLRKIDGTDYNAEWHTLILSDVTDVSTPVAQINLLNGLTVSSTEINLLAGMDSVAVQTQLNNKLSNSLPQNYLFIGNASNQVTTLAPGANGQVLTTVGASVVWTSPASPGDVSGPGSGNSTDNALVRWNGTTGASIQNSAIIIDDSDRMLFPNNGAIRTNVNNGDALLIQAYNVYTTAYVTFGTLTAGNPPTFSLNTTTTIGSDTIYRSLSGKTLAQPTVSEDAKSIRWNNGSNEWEYFTPGSGGGHTIQNAGTPLPARTNLNFLSDFVVTDDSGDDATDVAIAAFTGDVTKAQGGTSLTIANDAVTFAKFQNISTSRILGRTTASSGDVEELTVSSPLTLTGGALGIQVASGSQNGYLSSSDWTTFNNKWAKPSFTAGSVLFWGASDVDQANTKFFYDTANDLFYVGANSGAFTNSIGHFQKSVNSYAQVNLFNTSNGSSASGDYVVTADNGTDNSNFIDLGINSSGFSDGAFTIVGANGGYLYTNGGDLSIGTQGSNYIVFHTGGTLSSNERMRITSTGTVILTSPVTTGTVTTAGFQAIANSLTTGYLFDVSTTSATTGSLFRISSTSTANNYTAGTNGLFTVALSGANANSSRTTIGGYFSVTNTGTSSTNVALRAEASGASSNNWAAQFVGRVNVNTSGAIGLNIDNTGAFAAIQVGTANRVLNGQTSSAGTSNTSAYFTNRIDASVGSVLYGDIWNIAPNSNTTAGTKLAAEYSIKPGDGSSSTVGATSYFTVFENTATPLITTGFEWQTMNEASPGTRVITMRLRGNKLAVGSDFTPTSTIHSSGSFAAAFTSTSADLTIGESHHTVAVDASGAARTITLPAASGLAGRTYTIKKIDSSLNSVTIDGNASETIDGATTQALTVQYQFLTIVCTGSAWLIIGN